MSAASYDPASGTAHGPRTFSEPVGDVERLLELMERPAWMRDAACRGLPTSLFFPADETSRDLRAAKAVCASCPVVVECGEAGSHEFAGVWGGRSANQRRAGRTRKVVPPVCGDRSGWRAGCRCPKCRGWRSRYLRDLDNRKQEAS